MTDILEEDIELLAKYKRNKDCFIAIGFLAGKTVLNDSFTLEELMRLSKLIENDKLWILFLDGYLLH